MKVLSLFSGIGAFEKAMDNLGVKYNLVAFCEKDKPATRSYCAIHGVQESLNLGDITKVDEKRLPKDINLITYGFPCQDISQSGQMKGLFNEDGTKTRSGLFFEASRIIKEARPDVAIAENVKMLTSKKFQEQFHIVLRELERSGYNNYFCVLNSKDFGIPQHRERVFIVSIRRDVDNHKFSFPHGVPLNVRLKHIMEVNVDEKFFLSEKAVAGLLKRRGTNPKKSFRFRTGEDIAAPIDTGNGIRANMNFIKIETVGLLDMKGNEQVRRVYSIDGLSPTLNTTQGGHRQPKVLVGERVRKLTPKECFRLMGFSDADFAKAAAVNSNTQLYKQAGNSIVVPVVQAIIRELLDCGALKTDEVCKNA